MDKLTDKQKKFCDNYIKTGNAGESARRAGYKKPYVQGSQNLTKVNIKEYIKKRSKDVTSERTADMIEVNEFWANVLRDGENDLKDRIKVSELIGKSKGAFLDKVEHSGGMVIFDESDIKD